MVHVGAAADAYDENEETARRASEERGMADIAVGQTHRHAESVKCFRKK
jgi:hypothetical protein